MQTQKGLTLLENADLTLRDVIRKATGTVAFTPTRSASATDVIPADECRAVHARGDEVLLDTDNRLYALAQCAGVDTGTVPVGTATPAEIAQASVEIAQRANPVQQFTVSLPGDAEAATVQARLDRPDIQAPLVQTASPRTLTTTITEPTPGRLFWTVVEGATTNGPNELPSQSETSLMRLARMQVTGGTQDVLVTYLDQGGLRAVKLRLLGGVAQISPLDFGILGGIRGSALDARYEARQGVVVGILRDAVNDLIVWEADNPINKRAYAPTVPMPTPGATGGYAFDLFATVSFAGPIGVAWTAPNATAISYALLDAGGSITTEATADNVPTTVTRTAIERSILGDPFRFVVGAKYTTGAQKPVFSVGNVDPVLRLVANTTTTDIVYTRSASQVTAAWSAAGVLITTERPIDDVDTPTDSVAHVDSSGVYLALVDAAGFSELATNRQLQPGVPALRESGIQAVGFVGSATRTVYSYRTSATLLAVGVYTSTQDSTPTISAFAIGVDMEMTGAMGIGILGESGADDVELRFYGLIDAPARTIFAANLSTVTGGTTDKEQQIVATLPLFLTSTPLGAPPRALVGVAGVNTLIYEDSPTLFVQVAPTSTALVSGSWINRGAWSRLRHRTQRARTSLNAEIKQSDAVTAVSGQGLECNLVVCEQVGFGVNADILSSYVEFSGNLAAAGTAINPRTAFFGGDRGACGYVDTASANNIRMALWTPGEPLSFFASGISADGPVGIWDQCGSLTGDGVPFLLSVGCNSAQIIEIEIRDKDGSSVTLIDMGQDIIDVCGFARPAAGASAIGSVAVALANSTAAVIDLSLFPAITTITPNWTEIVPLPGVPVACSTSIESDGVSHTLWVELPYLAATSREIRIFNVVNGSSAPIPIASGGTALDSIQRAAIYSQQAVTLSQTVGAIELLSKDLAQVGNVGAIVLFASRSGEVVGRTARGATSLLDPNTRNGRYTHGSLVPDPSGGLSMGAELRDILLTNTKPVQSQLLRWPRAADPHRPAVVDSVTYAAMGGYPRSYDGQRTYETDWQSLPVASASIPAPAPGSFLSDGSYLIAVTWEYENHQGQLERSAPTFLDPIAVVANDAINVAFDGLPITERDRPLVTVWRSTADGESNLLFLDGQDFAQQSAGAGLISLFQSDEDLIKAPTLLLDQVPGGILAADRVDVTDFMGAANGRIWSVNPSTPTYARYSLQQRDGFALHFSGGALLEHTREETITSVHELSGRVLMFTANGIAYVHGDGVGNTGQGSYTVPMVEPVILGAVSHSATILTPDGIAYETGQGVRVMTRGLQSLDLGSMVDAHASRDEFVGFSLTYTPREEVIYIADENPLGSRTLFVFHPESLRWCTWTSPTPRDLATTTSGKTAILSTTGLVHVTERLVHDRGGETYTFAVETEWIRTSLSMAHQAFNFLTVRGFGSYDGDHAINVGVFADYIETNIVPGDRSASTNATIDASGRPYIWQLEIPGQLHYAIKIRVADSAEPNATYTLSGLDLRFDSVGRIAFGDLASDQKIGSA